MKTDILFKNYTDDDYEALCEFLIALNANNDSHILGFRKKYHYTFYWNNQAVEGIVIIELFYTFARIGLFTFGGGYAMISPGS